MAKQQIIPPGIDIEEYDWSNIDVGVERRGNKIILPKDPVEMSYSHAIRILAMKEEEENQEYDITEFIPGAFWDAGLAFYKAMQRRFGFVITKGIPSWFGRMRPDLITIKTGPTAKDVVQMPMGEFTLPNFTNPINARPMMKNGSPGFQVSTVAKKAERMILLQLVEDAREILRLESIYRGNAVRIRVDDEGHLNFGFEPEFIDVSSVSEADLIFNDDTQRLIETNLFTPVKKTSHCRRNRVPLKRTVLMEGPYGCGKSLTSKVAARVASDNDWTFIALDRCSGLLGAIEFAKQYQPAMIFAEDIDRMGDRDEDEDVNDLVNMLDGILTKDLEIIVVLTTNHIDRIDKALLRPGRFDAIIRIDAPDTQAVERLFRYYGGDLIAADADLSDAAAVLAGQIPATVREVVERAKLGMILDGERKLEPIHLRTAAVGMRRHLELLSAPEKETSAADMLATGLMGILSGGITPKESDKLDRIINLAKDVGKIAQRAEKKAGDAFAAGAAAAVSSQDVARQLDRIGRTPLPKNGGAHAED